VAVVYTLKKIGKADFGIGAVLGGIMWTSYLLGPLLMPAPTSVGFAQRVGMGFSGLQVAFVGSVVHAILWGPSLVVWMMAPQGYPFGMWLAPGFYAEVVEAPR
jgi:hypothetical protein